MKRLYLRRFYLIFFFIMLYICISLTGCANRNDRTDIGENTEENTEENIDVTVLDSKQENGEMDETYGESGEDQSLDIQTEEVVIYGVYTDQFPLKNYLSDANRRELETSGLMALIDTDLPFLLDLRDDGSCAIYVDAESWETKMTECLMTDADHYLTETFHREGVREDKFDKVARNAGYADYENLKSVFCSDYKEEYVNDFAQSILDFHIDGTYKLSGETVIFQFSEEFNVTSVQTEAGFDFLFEYLGKSYEMSFGR